MSLLRRFLLRYWSDISPQLVQGRFIFPCSRGICGPLVDIAILLHINSNFTGANDFTTAA
jgi:hypothetical protein